MRKSVPIVSGLAAATLLTACHPKGPERDTSDFYWAPSEDSSGYSAAEADVLRVSFQAFLDYWTDNNVLLTTDLIVLDSDETAMCGGPTGPSTTVQGSRISVFYCPPNDDIFVTEAYISNLRSGTTELGTYTLDMLKLIPAHELAHPEQLRRRIPIGNTDAERQKFEQQADCIAGAAMAATFPDAVDDAGKFYDWVIPDADHGDPADRKASFQAGVDGENCYTR